MASSSLVQFLLCFFFVHFSKSQPSSSSRPQGLILPLFQDQYTLQFVTRLSLGTPKVTINVVVDLGGKFLWVHSNQGCASISNKPIHCKSPQCSLASQSVGRVWCHNKTCSPITHPATKSELVSGAVTIQSSEVREPSSGAWIAGPNITARGFAFICGTTTGVLHGLANATKGVAGLGRSGLSLVSQFSAAFRIAQIFLLYLSRSENGFVYFGNETYLVQTPLFYMLELEAYCEDIGSSARWSKAKTSGIGLETSGIGIETSGVSIFSGISDGIWKPIPCRIGFPNQAITLFVEVG